MPYTVKLKRSAEKELDNLPTRIHDKVINILLSLKENPSPRNSKKLRGREGYRGDSKMPIITFEAGKLTKEQKKELISKFTSIACEVTKIPKQAFISSIREMPEENIGVGGITVEEIKQNINNPK